MAEYLDNHTPRPQNTTQKDTSHMNFLSSTCMKMQMWHKTGTDLCGCWARNLALWWRQCLFQLLYMCVRRWLCMCVCVCAWRDSAPALWKRHVCVCIGLPNYKKTDMVTRQGWTSWDTIARSDEQQPVLSCSSHGGAPQPCAGARQGERWRYRKSYGTARTWSPGLPCCQPAWNLVEQSHCALVRGASGRVNTRVDVRLSIRATSRALTQSWGATPCLIVCVFMYVYVYGYYMYMCMYVFICIHVYAYIIYICMYVYIYVYMYMYT